MRVLLVDDHRAVRGSVRNLNDDQPTMRVIADMRVVAEARSAEDARSQLEPPVDVGIVDYHLGPRPPRTGSRHSSNTSSRVPTCSCTRRSRTARWPLSLLFAGAEGPPRKGRTGARALPRDSRGRTVAASPARDRLIDRPSDGCPARAAKPGDVRDAASEGVPRR